MALSDQSVAIALEEKFLGSWHHGDSMDSSVKTERITRVTTDSAEDDENPYFTEDDEVRKASICHPQCKSDIIIFLSAMKSLGLRIRAEELREDPVNLNLKNSRNRSSHEANVKEYSFDNFGETVSNAYYAQDEKIRRASINPISDFQDQADPSKELIERPTSLEAHVSRSWPDRESLSPHETNLPTGVNIELPPCETNLSTYVELLDLELDKPLAVRANSWQQVDELLAHFNGRPDQKPYNMFGTTAFRSQPQWGDNGGEKHILQVDHHGHDYSVISPNSVPLPSPSSKDGDGDKQPLPPPFGVASSEAEGQLCFPSLAKICLFLGAEVCVTAPLIRYNTGTSLSEDAKTLLFVAKLLGFAGFLFCLGAYIVRLSRRASRLMTAMGCAATVCGFLSILGPLFPENLMLWLIGALCLLPISAIPFAFKRFV